MGSDKDLEKLVDKIMEEAPLDAPSSDFTDSVMLKIQKAESPSLVFKPLIPKWVITIALGLLVFFGYYLIVQNPSIGENAMPYSRYFGTVGSWLSDSLPQVQFSNKAIYVIFAIAAMIYIQTLLLKNYFNRRFA